MPAREGEIRVGAVTYLNARPLVVALGELAPRMQVVMDHPSRLADALAAGRLDVAMIPSIEYARGQGYTIISDACIACDGPVRSVKLFGRVPVQQIRTLALDEGSRTSAALVRILLRERFGVTPETLPLADRGLARRLAGRRRAVDRRPGDGDGRPRLRVRLGPGGRSGRVGRACRLCSRCGSPGRGSNSTGWPSCWRRPATKGSRGWRRSPGARRR